MNAFMVSEVRLSWRTAALELVDFQCLAEGQLTELNACQNSIWIKSNDYFPSELRVCQLTTQTCSSMWYKLVKVSPVYYQTQVESALLFISILKTFCEQ